MSARKNNRFRLPAILLAAALALSGCASGEAELISADSENESVSELEEEEDSASSESESESESESGEETVVVHICGAVQAEGVYTLPAGSRYLDAVEAAGGFTEEAAEDYLNLATVLTDGEKIVVPTEEEAVSLEAEEAAANESEEEESDGLVDINTAGREELMTLTGIGEVKADAIIAYREEHGDFETIEDIMNVSGIKEGAFAKIKDQIKVGTSDG